jgi:hypothetical protein
MMMEVDLTFLIDKISKEIIDYYNNNKNASEEEKNNDYYWYEINKQVLAINQWFL